MDRTIDHYYSLLSPWAFLGWPDLNRVAGHHGARVRHCPVDSPRVFQANGGVPGTKKSPAKQRYRQVELRRWSRFRGVELNPTPRHHPFDATLATRLVAAAERRSEAAGKLAYGLMSALWQRDQDLADPDALWDLAAELGFDADALFEAADEPETLAAVDANTQEAIERGVFGVPTYFLDDEMFWGQDRLDFIERSLLESANGGGGL